MLSSKERVRTALALEEPDRVPIDFLSNDGLLSRLRSHFGLRKSDHEALLEHLGVDIRELSLPYIGPVLHAPIAGRRVDSEWGIVSRWVAHETGGFWDYCDFPLAVLDAERAAVWKLPNPDDYDYDALDRQASAYEKSQQALCFGNPGLADILNTTGMLCGMEQVYLALALEDENWLHLVDRRVAVQLEITGRVLERSGKSIDYLWIGEDLGSQNGPLISMEHYRKILKPRHQKFVDLAASFDIPVMIHSCGSSSWVFEEFIHMGIQAVDTLQPEAANMEPSYLKERFGGSLAFHGGFSTAGSVVNGNAQEVLSDLEELLTIMKPGGGYLFCPTHLLQDNSRLENVLAVYENLPNMGKY